MKTQLSRVLVSTFPSIKGILVVFILFFAICAGYSKTILGPTYVLPNAELVYTLADTSRVADWTIAGDGVFLTPNIGVKSVRIRVKDTCNAYVVLRAKQGTSKLITKSIYVRDDKAPVFDAGFEVAMLLLNSLDSRKPTATDNSGRAVSVTLKDFKYAGESNCQMNLTWEAIDACGNKNTLVQVVTGIGQDTTAPRFSPYHECIFLSCDSVPAQFEKPAATDNASNLVQVELEQFLTNQSNIFGCATRTHTLVWRGTDACGNSSSITQFVYITDKKAPKFDSLPLMKLANCSVGEIPNYKPKVTDNCSNPVILTRLWRKIEVNQPCYALVTDLWEAEDGCYNRSRDTQRIEIKDTIPPRFVNVMPTCVPCNMIPAMFTPPMAIDNCDPSVTVELTNPEQVHVVSSRGCLGIPYVINLLWKATDDCGNVTYLYQPIDVRANCVMIGGGGDLQRPTDVSYSNVEAKMSSVVFNTEGVNMSMPSTTITSLPLTVYPNPTHSTIYINFIPPQSGKASVHFYDISGKIIGNMPPIAVNTLDNTTLQYTLPTDTPSGLIFYKLSIDGFLTHGKVQYIKQ
jgi:hypothetical protein